MGTDGVRFQSLPTNRAFLLTVVPELLVDLWLGASIPWSLDSVYRHGSLEIERREDSYAVEIFSVRPQRFVRNSRCLQLKHGSKAMCIVKWFPWLGFFIMNRCSNSRLAIFRLRICWGGAGSVQNELFWNIHCVWIVDLRILTDSGYVWLLQIWCVSNSRFNGLLTLAINRHRQTPLEFTALSEGNYSKIAVFEQKQHRLQQIIKQKMASGGFEPLFNSKLLSHPSHYSIYRNANYFCRRGWFCGNGKSEQPFEAQDGPSANIFIHKNPLVFPFRNEPRRHTESTGHGNDVLLLVLK